MRNKRAKTLRRFAVLIATGDSGYWTDNHGSRRLMPKSWKSVYRQLKRQRIHPIAYRAIQARIPQLEGICD